MNCIYFSEADLKRPVSMDSGSPFFTTPVKGATRSTSTSVSDIEAAASLIGFAESSASRVEFGLPTTSPGLVIPFVLCTICSKVT